MNRLLGWYLWTERVIGRGHATLVDTINRALRQLLSLSGIDPDAEFTGFAPVFHVAAYGATGSGSNESAAIIAAEAAAFAANGLLYFQPGKTYNIGTTGLTIRCGIAQGSEHATISYSGTGTAVTFGSVVSGTPVQWLTAFFPKIVQTNKAATGWAQAGGSDVGLKINNAIRGQFFIPHIQNFAVGLLMFGQGTGNVYNTVHLGQIDNCKVQIDVNSDATGWSNENTFLGGSLTFLSAEGVNVAGTRFCRLQTATNAPDNNRFIGVSMEGTTPEFYVECHGPDNVWLNCRWEASGTAKVNFDGANSARNIVMHGYNSNLVTVSQTNGALRNALVTTDKVRQQCSGGSAGVMVLSNTSSDASPVLATLSASQDPFSATPDTQYGVRISHQEIDAKATADAAPRVKIVGANGRITFNDGSGTNIDTQYLRAQGTDGIQHVGTKLGFFGAAPVAKPSITGSRGGNAALASLLTQLAALGIITDSTTA